jgi:hypothetical protein
MPNTLRFFTHEADIAPRVVDIPSGHIPPGSVHRMSRESRVAAFPHVRVRRVIFGGANAGCGLPFAGKDSPDWFFVFTVFIDLLESDLKRIRGRKLFLHVKRRLLRHIALAHASSDVVGMRGVFRVELGVKNGRVRPVG